MEKRWTLLAIIVVLAAALIAFAANLDFGLIGPGLPPSINGWYFPVPDGDRLGNTRIFTGTGAQHFGMIGEVNQSCPDMFPAISQDCIHAEYERLNPDMTSMEPRYIVVSWYFDRMAAFEEGERVLHQALACSGNVTTASVAIQPSGDNRQIREVPMTEFVGSKTSGYFVEYRRPLISSREDYLIIYYGVLGSQDLEAHATFLAALISEGGIPPDTSVIRPFTTEIPA